MRGAYIEYVKGKSRWTKSCIRFLDSPYLITQSTKNDEEK